MCMNVYDHFLFQISTSVKIAPHTFVISMRTAQIGKDRIIAVVTMDTEEMVLVAQVNVNPL